MSKPVPIHLGEIKNCKLELLDMDKWRSSLMALNGRKVRVVVEEPKDTRSQKANRYYWAYLSLIESETGNDANDIHELAKRKFLPPVYKTILGQEVKLPGSTTKLDNLEFTNYIQKIEVWSGIAAPNPEEFI